MTERRRVRPPAERESPPNPWSKEQAGDDAQVMASKGVPSVWPSQLQRGLTCSGDEGLGQGSWDGDARLCGDRVARLCKGDGVQGIVRMEVS